MKTIVIAEDEFAIASALREILESAGYKVLWAENGEEALSILAQTSPDLVLLDIMMPIVDGIETLGEMRRDERLAETPVVVMTAVPDASYDAVHELGVSAFLKKPFGAQTLLDVVTEMVGGPRDGPSRH